MNPQPYTARAPSFDARAPKVLLVTPPLLQPNAPYAAMPAIAGFLKAQRVEVVQADLSLELVLELFSEEGIDLAVRAARRMRRPSPEAAFLLDNEDAYRRWIGPAVAFLQGHRPELAWRLARPGELPDRIHPTCRVFVDRVEWTAVE